MHIKKSYLISFLNFLAYSNLFVAISAMGLAAYTIQVMDYGIDYFILFAIFFGTLFSYTFQRKINLIINKDFTPSKQNSWIIRQEKLNNAILIIAFIACFYFLYKLPAESIFLLLPLALLSLLYVLKIGNWPALRHIPFLKAFVIAFVWGGVMVLLPAIYKSHSWILIFGIKKQMLSISLALFVFALCLPFDIRDMQADKKDSLKTIPHQVGIKKTLTICWASLGIAGVINLSSYFIGFISLVESISFILALISTSLILFYYRKIRKPLAYGILLESCLMLPLFYYYLIDVLF